MNAGFDRAAIAPTMTNEDSVALVAQAPRTVLLRMEVTSFRSVRPAPRHDDVDMVVRVRAYSVDGVVPETVVETQTSRRVPSFDVTRIEPIFDREVSVAVHAYVGSGPGADFAGYDRRISVELANQLVEGIGALFRR